MIEKHEARTCVLLEHPQQLKDLYKLKPGKANERMMNVASVWSIAVRSNGNVMPFYKKVFMELVEGDQTAKVYRFFLGDEPQLLGSLPYEKAMRYYEGHKNEGEAE